MNDYKGFIIDNEKKVKLKKIPILICDKIGINKKKYPLDIVKQAVSSYLELCKTDPTRRYIFAKHPKDDDEEWIGLIAGIVDNLYFVDKILFADVTLFPTKWGYFIYWLLKNGYTVGVSIRGKSSFNEVTSPLSSGGSMIIKESNYLFLEGFDFVVFPSYIVTQARKENIQEKAQNIYLPYLINNESNLTNINYMFDNNFNNVSSNILENIKEQAKPEDVINFEIIKEKYINDENKNLNIEKNWRYEKMFDEKNVIQTELEKIKLEKTRHELELERIAEKVAKNKAELEMLEEKIKEKEEKIKGNEIFLEKLVETKKQYEEIKEKYENLIKEYEDKKKEFEELEGKYNEIIKQIEDNRDLVEEIKEKRGELILKCCGKEFSKDNKPKIRVVPVEEKISKASWGDIDHVETKKLVYLSGDKKIAEKVFGVVEGMNHWLQLKYPVYQHEKSEKDGYDVDMVLNYYGLKTALAFMEGRAGQKLSSEQKNRMIKWLYDKYSALVKNKIIDKIPATLENMYKAVKVKEKVEIDLGDNKVAKELFEIMFDNGLIDIEIDEETIKEKATENEKIKIEINDKLLIENVSNSILMALNGEDINKVLEQTEMGQGSNQQINSYEDGINLIWNLLNDSQIAQDLELDVKEKFETFIQKIIDNLLNNNPVEALKAINILQNALKGTGAVHVVIPMILFGINKRLESQNQETNPEQPQEPAQSENNEGNIENTGSEGTIEKTTEKSKLNINIDKNKKREEDMKKETFDALKNLIENSFEGIKVENENELIPVIEKIVDDYTSIYNENMENEVEMIKKDILLLAYEKGVEITDVKEKIDSINNIDELKSIMNEIKENKIEDVKEKSTTNNGKGYSFVVNNNKEKDNFDDILESI